MPPALGTLRPAWQTIWPQQIQQLARLTPKARLNLANSLSTEVLALAISAERRLHPELAPEAARREVLHRYYRLASS